MKNILICGVVKNAENRLTKNILFCKKLGSYFDNFKMIVYENNSTDNTKKILNLECAKCMINMIDDNTKSKTIDIDNLIDNENNVNCNKCKKFTELSDTITSLIDNLSIKK